MLHVFIQQIALSVLVFLLSTVCRSNALVFFQYLFEVDSLEVRCLLKVSRMFGDLVLQAPAPTHFPVRLHSKNGMRRHFKIRQTGTIPFFDYDRLCWTYLFLKKDSWTIHFLFKNWSLFFRILKGFNFSKNSLLKTKS